MYNIYTYIYFKIYAFVDETPSAIKLYYNIVLALSSLKIVVMIGYLCNLLVAIAHSHIVATTSV